jgi:2-dehydro-3-deoxygluconokinase
MPDLITFGEIMLRLTTPGHQRFLQAEHFAITPGGAEANAAVLVARLGGSAEFVTRLPAHDLGQRAIDALRQHGVGTRHIARGGERIGLYFLEQGVGPRPGRVVYDRAGSAFSEAKVGDFDWPEILAGARWFHWSGITPAVSDSAAALVAEACAAAKNAGLKVSFDLNYRAKLWSRERAGAVLGPLMKHVDLCVTSAEEARGIFALDVPESGAERERIAAEALRERFGFPQVALTTRRGDSAGRTDWGAMLMADGRMHESPRYDLALVDRIGAGDTFTGGLIFSLMRGDAPRAALDFAVAASALQHTIPGDFPLLSLEEVEALQRGGGGGRVQR